MCGIAGVWQHKAQSGSNIKELAHSLRTSMPHRGPDDHNIFVDDDAGFFAIHRRLAVVDLTQAGRQPMRSSCGRYVIIYNGEIYNADELRPKLKQQGRTFRGSSDTEVLLEAIAGWGLEAAVSACIGMFAFAVWDMQHKRLHLVRDRLGIKPLYFGKWQGQWMFASELSSFKSLPNWQAPKLSSRAVQEYLFYGYVPTPLSIFEDFKKVRPGHIVTIEAKGDVHDQAYWSLGDVVKGQKALPTPLSYDEVKRRVADLIGDAVKRRMLADVPLGAFLSGGIDSSLVVALMQSHARQPVQTFSIGFEDRKFDESVYAEEIAKHLGTQHTSLFMDGTDLMNLVPAVISGFDEPLGDSSALPTYALSQLTRQHVTVALSGDGGDEIFAGYERYKLMRKLQQMRESIPGTIARRVSQKVPSAGARLLGQALNWWSGARPRVPGLEHRMTKLRDVLTANDGTAAYLKMVSHWREGDVGLGLADSLVYEDLRQPSLSLVEQLQFVDTVSYLPDDILVKVDRMSMAHALEARVPLIDHRVVEMSWSLPENTKLVGEVGKFVLRDILSDYVPPEMFERPKKGFSVPLDSWLRGPLQQWAHTCIYDFDWQGVLGLNARAIYTRWESFLKVGSPNTQAIWMLLVLAEWSRAHLEEKG